MQPALPSTAMNAAAIRRLVPELFMIIAELEAADLLKALSGTKKPSH